MTNVSFKSLVGAGISAALVFSICTASLLAFPNYSNANSYSANPSKVELTTQEITEATLTIEGLTSLDCEHRVTNSLKGQHGVISASSSYKDGSALVTFDSSLTSVKELTDAVKIETGYEVTEYQITP